MDILLTIIMSNYNQEKYIEKAIKSVLSQKVNFRYRLVITDDCSQKDNSVNIIRKYVEKYNDIEAIYASENGGYLENILRVKRNLKTKYFCLLDADDYWTDENFLQDALDYMESHNEVVIYESNVYVNEGGERYLSRKYKPGIYSKQDFLQGKRLPVTQTTGMVFRNVIFKNGVPSIMEESRGTISERSFEGDYDRFIMHLKHGKAYYCPNVVGVYRYEANGIWASLKREEKILISAQSTIDYGRYYEECLDFFIRRVKDYVKQYYLIKLKEIVKNKYQYTGIEDVLLKNIIDYLSRNRNMPNTVIGIRDVIRVFLWKV